MRSAARARWRRLAAGAGRWRAVLLCAAVFAAMALLAPRFLTAGNVRAILKAASVNLPAAAGFTVVLICGQLDLSVGSVMTAGGMLVVAAQPVLGWAGALAAAVAVGAAVGTASGLLVARARINSFIVTLGMMIMVRNAVLMAHDGTLPAASYALSDWLQAPLAGVLTARVAAAVVLTALLAGLLTATPVGRGFYLLGGGAETAWYAGLNVRRYTVGAFALSGALAAFGGALVAMSEAVASPTLGDESLMAIVAAVIIGGTSMEGGRGGVVGTAVALVALAALINGLNCCGAGYEIQLMASGMVLALVVLWDAWTLQRRRRSRPRLADLPAGPAPPTGADEPRRKDAT